MGISKHPRGWLARKMIAGAMVQVLKPTEELAEAEYAALVEISDLYRNDWASRIKKRSNAKAADLPVGFVDTVDTYTSTSGTVNRYNIMKITIKHHGKAKTLSCSYGENTRMNRTRNDALLMLLKRLKEFGYEKAAI
ncbi:hypothetical protein HC723_16055 [Vibrio sp. S11_S32]|uniref:hypothetical protein n=1 Tax=Vibrio sp. S11_S32 TaxID=2720225 RepID=UPI00168076B1|nr:hypothetical protein [Vibrio sp. S11_S32]MBD1577909.1 hypothetical protein [Vibrio sp. S11_S32]